MTRYFSALQHFSQYLRNMKNMKKFCNTYSSVEKCGQILTWFRRMRRTVFLRLAACGRTFSAKFGCFPDFGRTFFLAKNCRRTFHFDSVFSSFDLKTWKKSPKSTWKINDKPWMLIERFLRADRVQKLVKVKFCEKKNLMFLTGYWPKIFQFRNVLKS